MDGRSAFAGGDQEYLRTVQYVDSAKVGARAALHQRYSTSPVPWFPWVAGLVDWPEGVRILDAGCGPGYLWEAVADQLPAGLRLTLSDLSPGMVDEASTRAAGAGVTVADARAADTQDLPFAAGAFDVVLAAHTLYHLPDPARGVAELARVLDPAGVLLAPTNGPDHLRELNDARVEVFGPEARDLTPDVFGRLTGAPMLDRAFDSVTWFPFADSLACTEPDDVMAFLTSSPPGEDADEDQLAQLRDVVQARFDAGGGTFAITKDAGAFVCRGPRPAN